MKKILLAIAAALALFVGPVAVAPLASADTLPNGYSITCTPNGDDLICNISGCPRVHEDEAGDVVHVRLNGHGRPGDELSKGCNSDATITEYSHGHVAATISVQGCRKNFPASDDCGPWSDYSYVPPAPAPAPAPAPPPVMSNAGDPVKCVGCAAKAPTSAAVPDVTNAIQASFGQPGLSTVDFNVTNTSNLDATCNYTATANSINPLVPRKTTRQFNVPANGNHTETFDGAPTLTNYNVTLSCKDASGKQLAELGHVTTSVLW